MDLMPPFFSLVEWAFVEIFKGFDFWAIKKI